MKKAVHALSLVLIGIAAVPAAVGIVLLWGALRMGDRIISLSERGRNEEKA